MDKRWTPLTNGDQMVPPCVERRDEDNRATTPFGHY